MESYVPIIILVIVVVIVIIAIAGILIAKYKKLFGGLPPPEMSKTQWVNIVIRHPTKYMEFKNIYKHVLSRFVSRFDEIKSPTPAVLTLNDSRINWSAFDTKEYPALNTIINESVDTSLSLLINDVITNSETFTNYKDADPVCLSCEDWIHRCIQNYYRTTRDIKIPSYKAENPSEIPETAISMMTFYDALFRRAVATADRVYQHKYIVQLPETNCSVLSIGDLHGDFRSLTCNLAKYISCLYIDPATHLVFTGDYIDRIGMSFSVVYEIIRLFVLYPGRVHILRGNHDDIRYSLKYTQSRENGLLESMLKKFAEELSETYIAYLYYLIGNIFARLPAALIAGDKLYCHGFIPRELMGVDLKQYTESHRVATYLTYMDAPPALPGGEPIREQNVVRDDIMRKFVWMDYPNIEGRGDDTYTINSFSAFTRANPTIKHIIKGHDHNGSTNTLVEQGIEIIFCVSSSELYEWINARESGHGNIFDYSHIRSTDVQDYKEGHYDRFVEYPREDAIVPPGKPYLVHQPIMNYRFTRNEDGSFVRRYAYNGANFAGHSIFFYSTDKSVIKKLESIDNVDNKEKFDITRGFIKMPNDLYLDDYFNLYENDDATIIEALHVLLLSMDHGIKFSQKFIDDTLFKQPKLKFIEAKESGSGRFTVGDRVRVVNTKLHDWKSGMWIASKTKMEPELPI